mgnify:CR=1 FL=1
MMPNQPRLTRHLTNPLPPLLPPPNAPPPPHLPPAPWRLQGVLQETVQPWHSQPAFGPFAFYDVAGRESTPPGGASIMNKAGVGQRARGVAIRKHRCMPCVQCMICVIVIVRAWLCLLGRVLPSPLHPSSPHVLTSSRLRPPPPTSRPRPTWCWCCTASWCTPTRS